MTQYASQAKWNGFLRLMQIQNAWGPPSLLAMVFAGAALPNAAYLFSPDQQTRGAVGLVVFVIAVGVRIAISVRLHRAEQEWRSIP